MTSRAPDRTDGGAPDRSLDWVAGGGNMGGLVRSLDWSTTPLGPLGAWPQSLRTIVSTCLSSRFPILIWWGPELVMIYNDALAGIIGNKHPRALGQRGAEGWWEVWNVLGPMLTSVIAEGASTWSENQRLDIERTVKGYLEETYFTFSYSPIRDESGGVGGVFCAVTETTAQVLSERRLRALGAMARRTAEAATVGDACLRAAAALEENAADVPVAFLYLAEGPGEGPGPGHDVRLAGAVGVSFPEGISGATLEKAGCADWPLGEVLNTGNPVTVDEEGVLRALGAMGCQTAAWPTSALLLPFHVPGKPRPSGVLVVGLSPCLLLDEQYRGFLLLVAGHIASAIASARTLEAAEQRAEALAQLDRAKTAFFSNVSHDDSPSRPTEALSEGMGSLAAAGPESATGVRILLVDDNADMREDVGRLLREHWSVDEASDGVEALAVARGCVPSLVLTDILMPNLDGFGLLRALREDSRTRSVPVVMLSARAGEESRVEGLTAGADDYLIKPFSAKELVARVRTHLELGRLRSASERLQAEREALLISEREARAEAERALLAKDEFLAMLGHELRNPLAPIMTALQLLRLRGNDGAERERTIIERQVKHLTTLVDDLLDISGITRGKVELKREPIELSLLVARAIEMVGPLVEQRRQELTVQVPRRGLLIYADPTRMAQVISNLLTNAAKYTAPGGRIRVAAVLSGSSVELSVADNGIGIAEEALPHVFDLFVQERQAIDRAQGGLGLGLAIVRSLVTMHGGTARVTSPGRGAGSTFTIRLPSAASESEQRARLESEQRAKLESEALEVPAPVAPGLQVLIVDDNVDAAEMMAVILTELGCETRVAYDGPSALALVEAFQPELALLDIGLPAMDGFELARLLRARPNIAKMRLVAVTGYGQRSDIERTRKAGFDEHLVKPVEFEKLKALLTSSASKNLPPESQSGKKAVRAGVL